MARPAEEAPSDRAWRTFAPDPSEVFAARHFVTCVLETWDLDLEDAALLVSELATNAVLHARSDFEVTVIRASRSVRVEVFDQNTRLPSFAVAPTDAYSGRGLMLLQGLSTNWGVESHSDIGKTIWFEVEVPKRGRRSGRTIGALSGKELLRPPPPQPISPQHGGGRL
jgi:anti-sigma regulatory factor (Ser/Thr protein kinase)